MKNFMITLPKAVKTVIDGLGSKGYSAYIVGGCVRDSIMGKEPNDWDVTTSALPEEVKAALNGFSVIETGVRHGTVTALIDGTPVEITTFRIDGGYLDSRHPESVTFTRSLTEDLKRRDFTMNAIAYSPSEGLIDPFDGASDIRQRIIRTVGSPDERFKEDALRILRAIRFSAVLDFAIDDMTAQAVISNRELLLNISAERIMSEMTRLLCGKNVLSILLSFKEVFFTLIPELSKCDGFEQKSVYHIFDVYTHIAHTAASVKPDPVLRLTMLFHDIGKPECFTLDEDGRGHFYGHAEKSAEIAHRTLRRLKFDRDTIERVTRLVRFHDIDLPCEERILLRRLNKFGEKTLRNLIAVKRADNLAQSESVRSRQSDLDEVEKLLSRIISEQKCFSLKDLAVNGGDIKDLGVSEGQEIGRILNVLLESVIDSKIPNERSVLIREAKTMLN